MVTIKDVAKEAGVSIATVSMVVNNKGLISPRTTKKVERAIDKLNYVSNVSAKTLVTKRSNTIGLVVGSLRNSYFTELIAAVEDVARRNGYSVFICDAERSVDTALKSFRALQSRGVDGILFSLSINLNDDFINEVEQLTKDGITIISLTRCLKEINLSVVSFMDQEEIYEMVQEIVKLGHKKIGAIGAPCGSWLNESRLEIFKRVLREWNYLDEDLIECSGLSIEDGKQAALKLLNNHPEITAIYAINDVVAIGALQAARSLNIKVPEQLSIVGSDGIPVGELVTPVLTTVVTPRHEIGKIATELLIKKIEGQAVGENLLNLVPCTIRKGESLAKARE